MYFAERLHVMAAVAKKCYPTPSWWTSSSRDSPTKSYRYWKTTSVEFFLRLVTNLWKICLDRWGTGTFMPSYFDFDFNDFYSLPILPGRLPQPRILLHGLLPNISTYTAGCLEATDTSRRQSDKRIMTSGDGRFMAGSLVQLENVLNIYNKGKEFSEEFRTKFDPLACENPPIFEPPIWVPQLTKQQCEEAKVDVPEKMWNLTTLATRFSCYPTWRWPNEFSLRIDTYVSTWKPEYWTTSGKWKGPWIARHRVEVLVKNPFLSPRFVLKDPIATSTNNFQWISSIRSSSTPITKIYWKGALFQ